MSTNVVPVTSKTSATTLGLIVPDGTLLINTDSASQIWVSSSPGVLPGNGTPIPHGGSVSKQGDGPAYGVLDAAATGPVSVVITSDLDSYDSGSVTIQGGTVIATLSGPVTVAGTVAVAGNVAITGTPAVTISGTPNVNVAGNVNVTNATIPVTGTVAVSGTTNVAVTGTPAVTISGTPNVNVAGNVNVTNASIPVTGNVGVTGTANVAVVGTPAVTITGTPTVSVSTGTVNIGTVGSIIENTEVLTDTILVANGTVIASNAQATTNVSAYGSIAVEVGQQMAYQFVTAAVGGTTIDFGILTATAINYLQVRAGFFVIINQPGASNYGLFANNRNTQIRLDTRESTDFGDLWSLPATVMTAATAFPLTQATATHMQGLCAAYFLVTSTVGKGRFFMNVGSRTVVLADMTEFITVAGLTTTFYLRTLLALPSSAYSISFECQTAGTVTPSVNFFEANL